MKRIDKVNEVAAIIGDFEWGNFGLDDVEMAESSEWAYTLADEIVARVEVWE
jgi:hypothetical protein